MPLPLPRFDLLLDSEVALASHSAGPHSASGDSHSSGHPSAFKPYSIALQLFIVELAALPLCPALEMASTSISAMFLCPLAFLNLIPRVSALPGPAQRLFPCLQASWPNDCGREQLCLYHGARGPSVTLGGGWVSPGCPNASSQSLILGAKKKEGRRPHHMVEDRRSA